MFEHIRGIGLCIFMIAWITAPRTEAALVLVSAGTSVDTNTSVSGLFESGEEMDANDPPEVARTGVDLPVLDSQSAQATITDTSASASASIALQFDSSSITGSGAFSETVESTPFSFSSAYARASFGVFFSVAEPTPYRFSGSISYNAPDDLIAPNKAGIFLLRSTGSEPLSNFTEALDSTEVFSFSGVLAPGIYEISLTNAFGGTTLETVFPDLSRAESGSFDFQLTVVPLPAAAWLFASSLGLLGCLRRRTK